MQGAPLAALDCHSRCTSGPMGTNPNSAIRPQPRFPSATSSATNSPPDSQESTRYARAMAGEDVRREELFLDHHIEELLDAITLLVDPPTTPT
jgi:hypothetical protein